MSNEINVQRIFAKLTERFNADNAAGLEAVFQFAVLLPASPSGIHRVYW